MINLLSSIELPHFIELSLIVLLYILLILVLFLAIGFVLGLIITGIQEIIKDFKNKGSDK